MGWKSILHLKEKTFQVLDAQVRVLHTYGSLVFIQPVFNQ